MFLNSFLNLYCCHSIVSIISSVVSVPTTIITATVTTCTTSRRHTIISVTSTVSTTWKTCRNWTYTSASEETVSSVSRVVACWILTFDNSSPATRVIRWCHGDGAVFCYSCLLIGCLLRLNIVIASNLFEWRFCAQSVTVCYLKTLRWFYDGCQLVSAATLQPLRLPVVAEQR